MQQLRFSSVIRMASGMLGIVLVVYANRAIYGATPMVAISRAAETTQSADPSSKHTADPEDSSTNAGPSGANLQKNMQSNGAIAAVTAKKSAPLNAVLPSFNSSSGDLNMGATLTANVGTWEGNPAPTFTCTWYINDRIAQAQSACNNTTTPSKFYLQNYYYGEVPSLVVTATNVVGNAVATSMPTKTYITRAQGQAVRAGDFDEAIGAVAHMNETGDEWWSKKGYSYSVDNLSTALTYLPYLHHIRGGWGYKNNAALIHKSFPDVTFVARPSCCADYEKAATTPDSNGTISKAWLLANAGILEAIEGANEVDAMPNYSCPYTSDGTCPGSGHPPSQAQIDAGYANAKADQPILWRDFSAVLPIYTPTVQTPDNMRKMYGARSAGVNPSNFDFVNEHHYTEFQRGQRMQWSYLYAGEAQKSSANGVAPVRGGDYKEIVERPTVITETGWMGCPHGRISGNCSKNTPDAVIAKLLPSMLLDAHSAGVYKTYIYELLDELPDPGKGNGNESYHHGIFALSTFANYSPVFPKAQATSLKYLMAFMHDSGPNAKIFEPGQWNYALTELPNTGSNAPYHKGQSLLFQRSDGKFVLAVWDDVVLWNFADGTAMSGVRALSHPVLTQMKIPSEMSQYDPITNTTTTLSPSPSMKLDLPDHPILILITP